ncbi:MAG: DUF2061 domain-containing protein [Erythrobacter sp.]|jgi:uncharacterized membrane protein
MREAAEPPIFGPESLALAPSHFPRVTHGRHIAKAVSWRIVGSIDTLVLSFLLITFLGPLFGLEHDRGQAIKAAGTIAVTEVATKMLLYYLHEHGWEKLRWGLETRGHRRIESYRRSSTKTATWRVLASLDTMALAWLFTGNIATAISIGGMEVMTKLALYFVHERAWAQIPFGIISPAHPSGSEIPTA